MTAVLNSLTESEMALVRETARENLNDLDEDGLVELHGRIRRARDKYVKLYRRGASAKVAEYGGRGKARPKNTRNADKAEVFEDALARVSRQLATAARHSAMQLRAERLDAAQRTPSAAPSRPRTTAKRTTAPRDQRPRRRTTAPGLTERRASTQAKGARRQAKRDSRTT